MRWRVAAGLVVLAGGFPVHATRLPLRSYGSAEGLLDPGVNRVAIGPAGFVWIATRGGLWRFDGERFDVLGSESGVPRREVYDFAFAGDGSLWIASEAGLYHGDPSRTEPGRPAFVEVRLGGAPGPVVPHRVAPSADGSVWVGTFRGLWRVRPGPSGPRAEPFPLPGENPTQTGWRIQALAVAPDGSVWLGSHAHGTYRIRPGGAIEHRGSDDVGCNFVRAFLFDGGVVWTAYLGGVARLEAAAFGKGDPPIQLLTPAEGLPGIDTQSLLRVDDGHVLASTTAGIAELERDSRGRWRVAGTLDRSAGLPDDDVAALARDATGNLWIGFTQRGLAKRIAGAFVERDDVEEAGARIAGLAGARDGRLAVLSKTGATAWTLRLVGARGTETRRLALPPGLGYVGWGMQQLLAEEPDGTWWVASGDGLLRYGASAAGTRRLEGPPDAVLGEAQGLPSSDVYVLYLDSAGDLWASAYSRRPGIGSVVRVPKGSLRVEAFSSGELGSGSLAVGFAEDRAHDLWIAFEDGSVVERRAGRFERVPQPLGPLSTAPFVLDGRGRMWILGNGLAVVDRPEEAGATARRYALPYPTRDLTFASGADDGSGTLYLGTPRGVLRLEPDRGRARLLTASDGLVGGAIRLAMRDEDGHLWFSDVTGLSRLTPGPDVPAEAHAARIRFVRVAGVPASIPTVGTTEAGEITVGPYQHTVEVGWFAVHHGPGEPPQFEHRLVGMDERWSAPTEARSVLYAGLAPGRYRFAVRAVEADGAATEPAVVELRVLAPVWRRGWFLALAVAAAAGLVYAAHRARVARAVAVERVRTRIATDLHDEIGSTLSQISVLSQVAERDAASAPGAALRSLSRITELARGVVEAMGETVWAISPREDLLSGLVHRMRRFGLDLYADGAAEIRLDLPSHDSEERLDPDVRRTIWLVFKEALHNAKKHAFATTVEASLRRVAGGFELVVRDDGRGFDPARGSSGHGLFSMRRRAEAIAGRLEVRAAAGGPTTVVLRVPKRSKTLFRRTVGPGASPG